MFKFDSKVKFKHTQWIGQKVITTYVKPALQHVYTNI